MKELNGSSKQVFKIIQAIDAIAFQTSILALNAAVAAAGAGEAQPGKDQAAANALRAIAERLGGQLRNSAERVTAAVPVPRGTTDIGQESTS
jgi:hypothetical protein